MSVDQKMHNAIAHAIAIYGDHDDAIFEAVAREKSKQVKIQVVWNNLTAPFSTELYRPYSTETSLEDVEPGVVRQTWLGPSFGGYARTFRVKENSPAVRADHIYYISYMLNAPRDGGLFSCEWAGGVISPAITVVANTWMRFSDVAQGNKNGWGVAYFLNYRGGNGIQVGDTALAKNPLYIDLTMMFGAGNEPDKDGFEAMCAKNGIDLEGSHELDVDGTQVWWIM